MNSKINVGIIGGGQLGMMMLQEANFDIASYTVLESSSDCPASPFCQKLIVGSLNDASAIEQLAAVSDVLTWEIEHINVDALIQLEANGKKIIPKPSVLKMIQDKGAQKLFFQENNIPTAPFELVDSSMLKEVDYSKFPQNKIVVKTRTGGYDGKGVSICSKADVQNGNIPFEGSVLLEQFVADVLELAVIVAVDQHGKKSSFPSIEMYFNAQSNLVEFLYSPAQISVDVETKARQIAENVIEAFQSPGLFAVELFLTQSGEILVNEIAPRPHNSGHHTIEGCVTSQFAQLNRILLGQELGDTTLIQPSAMLNIVGPNNVVGGYQLENEETWKQQNDVFIHMYGKRESRPHRKLGHVTIIANTFGELIERAEYVKENIKVIPS
jgi:5-(carboxyamino)imidazole ribonucleotide synthase